MVWCPKIYLRIVSAILFEPPILMHVVSVDSLICAHYLTHTQCSCKRCAHGAILQVWQLSFIVRQVFDMSFSKAPLSCVYVSAKLILDKNLTPEDTDTKFISFSLFV